METQHSIFNQPASQTVFLCQTLFFTLRTQQELVSSVLSTSGRSEVLRKLVDAVTGADMSDVWSEDTAVKDPCTQLAQELEGHRLAGAQYGGVNMLHVCLQTQGSQGSEAESK